MHFPLKAVKRLLCDPQTLFQGKTIDTVIKNAQEKGYQFFVYMMYVEWTGGTRVLGRTRGWEGGTVISHRNPPITQSVSCKNYTAMRATRLSSFIFSFLPNGKRGVWRHSIHAKKRNKQSYFNLCTNAHPQKHAVLQQICKQTNAAHSV